MTRFADWQAQGSFVTVRGHQIFVREAGEGPPVLLLHGFPSSSHDFARLLPLLGDACRAISFDFLGFGLSDKPRSHNYSLFEQADIAEAVAAAHGLKRLNLLCHDMGNSVALELLKRGSLQVERLIMLNGSVWLEFYRPLLTQRLLLHPWTGPVISALGLIRKRAFASQFGSVFAEPLPDQEMDDFWSAVTHNGGLRIYHRLIRYLNERRVHEQTWLDALSGHSAPLTLIWGQRDPVAVPRIAEEVLRYRPRADYHPLEDAGHYPQWEAPAEVATLVRKALSSPLCAEEGGGAADA